MTWSTLHDLCAHPTPSATAAIIKRTRAFPEELGLVDDRGYTPLHIAVTSRNPPLEAIRALVGVCPNAVMAKDLHGDTPMHLALQPNVSVDLISILLHACPDVASDANKEGLMPIHVACRYCCDKDHVIGLLLEANPFALRSRTKMGSLVQNKKKKVAPALLPNDSFAQGNQHLVLDGTTSSSWRSSQITSPESQFEDRSIQIRDGSYPLHMAIANGAPRSVIEMLIKAAPDCLSLTDKFDRTCLHLAVANGATKDTIVTTDPITMQEIQVEHEPRTTLEVIELIHLMGNKQVSRQDKSKNLPLHTALQGGCSIDCAKHLIRAYPHAVNVKNKDGMKPSEVALKFGNCSKEVLYLLKLSNGSTAEI